jgi:hypothetical protein
MENILGPENNNFLLCKCFINYDACIEGIDSI